MWTAIYCWIALVVSITAAPFMEVLGATVGDAASVAVAALGVSKTTTTTTMQRGGGFPDLARGTMRKNTLAVTDHRPIITNRLLQYVGLLIESEAPAGMLRQYIEMPLGEPVSIHDRFHDLFIFPTHPRAATILNATSFQSAQQVPVLAAALRGDLDSINLVARPKRFQGYNSIGDIVCYAYPNGTRAAEERASRGRSRRAIHLREPPLRWTAADSRIRFDQPGTTWNLAGRAIESYVCQ